MPFSRNILMIAGIAAVAAAIFGSIYFFRNGKFSPGETLVRRGDITEIVKASGAVKPARSVDLAFQAGGRVSYVSKDVGAFVGAGEPIAGLENADLSAQLAKAEADLAAQKASLEKIKADLQNQYENIINVLNDAYSKATDAVRNQIDNLFANTESEAPQLNFSTTNSQAADDSQTGRLRARAELNSWKNELAALPSPGVSNDNLYASLPSAEAHLYAVRDLISAVTAALNSPYGLSLTGVSAGRAFVSSANAEVSAAISELVLEKETIDSENGAAAVAAAGLKSYEAAIENIKANLAKTAIYSPISGVISKEDAKVGEVVSPGAALVSIISVSQFEIEIYLSEADIAKIAAGNGANITLDAYGVGTLFAGKVSAVDPAASVINGVPSYKVTVSFEKPDARIKAGMTANVFIIAQKRPNALVIPESAVITRGSDKFVLIDAGGKNPEERKVELGISGENGEVEVVSGLNEGERVISFGGL